MSTRYHTSGTAVVLISFPKMPVNPQIKTVKCNMSRFLFSVAGEVSCDIIWEL